MFPSSRSLVNARRRCATGPRCRGGVSSVLRLARPVAPLGLDAGTGDADLREWLSRAALALGLDAPVAADPSVVAPRPSANEAIERAARLAA